MVRSYTLFLTIMKLCPEHDDERLENLLSGSKNTMTDCKFKGHGHPASLTTQDIYRLKATAVEVSRASILIMRA